MNLEQALVKITELEAKLSGKDAELAEATKVKSLVDTQKVELETAKASLAATQDELNKSNNVATELKNKLATAETEVSTLKTEKVKTERVEKIKDTLCLSKQESEDNYLVVATLDDSAFTKWLEKTKQIIDAKVTSKTKDGDVAVAELRKQIDETNKKLATAQLEDAKVAEASLGTQTTTADVNSKKLQAVKNIFNKKD